MPDTATDWYVKVQVHNDTEWKLPFYQRILVAAGTIEKEPENVPSKSTGSGGKYDAPSGPYGVSVLIAYDAPDSNWRFAWAFVMPYVGHNVCEVRIIDSKTNIDDKLFNSMDGSQVTSTSQDMTVNGTSYKFTVSPRIQ